jgi:hypothetical protein
VTSQAITATVSGPTGGKAFADDAQDGKWDGNNLLDTVSSSDLGQVMPGQSINYVCVTYTGGAALWRIQSRSTLAIKRYGFCSHLGTVDFDECKVTPYTITSDDILTVYPVPVEDEPSQVNVLAWLDTSTGPQAFGALGVIDAMATEITSLVTAQSLGEFAPSVLTGIGIQVEDAAYLTSATLIGADGGTIVTWYGTMRDAGHYYLNLAAGAAIPIDKGTVIKVTTVTA